METLNNPSTKPAYSSSVNKDQDELWRLAKRRATFKKSLATYFVMNSFFVAIWFFSSGIHSYFWPIWPMLGWGLGIAIQYFGAYHSQQFFTTEQEYEKLKAEQNR